MSNVERHRRMVEAWSAGDYATFREVVHPDCEVESVALGKRMVVGREQLIEHLESVRGTLWEMGPMTIEELDEDTVLSHASVRVPLPGGGHSASTVYWLTTYRNDQIVRTRSFRSGADARRAWGAVTA